MKAIILSGGKGRKIWPYSRYHNKGMLKIGNQTILQYMVDNLIKNHVTDISIVAGHCGNDIQRLFRHYKNVEIILTEDYSGTAKHLQTAINDEVNEYLVLFGDCFILENDLKTFIEGQNDILISQLHQDSILQICAEVDENMYLKKFWGHPRGTFEYFAAAFKLKHTIIPYLQTSSVFNMTKVGVGSPKEMFLESAVNDFVADGNVLTCFLSQDQIFDIDKPWHILEANHYYNCYIAKKLSGQWIGENTTISKTAQIGKNVKIGHRCYIGDYVVVKSGCVIEDDTIIDQGAVIDENVHIGQRCRIENYCHIGACSSIGDECIIGHTAEIIEAVLFDKVYLYHYGEYYGIIGTHSDVGAGTTCGTLRFDDGKTMHQICLHREIPSSYANACYIGDYSRTGVSAILLPGCKVGSKSVVGSGVILNEDVEDHTLIYPKQELCRKKWDDDQYGW